MTMKTYYAFLTSDDLHYLNKHYISHGSNAVGLRAIEIIKKHIHNKYKGSNIKPANDGPDLIVKIPGRKSFSIEVKGTKKVNPFIDLRVSEKRSHDALVIHRIKLLRVTEIFKKRPIINELVYGVDFKLVPEKRWRCIRNRENTRPGITKR